MSVFWYIPNVVGYIRILLTLLAAAFIFEYHLLALVLGVASQLLDALDGTLARRFGQCSAFGAILDYSIDRMFVACWMIILSMLQPHFWYLFMLILSLDLMSHLFHMDASFQQGKASHKQLDAIQSPLLKFYYRNSKFMFAVCFSHDIWILTVAMNHFYPGMYSLIAIAIMTPFMLFKAYVHILQLISASRSLVALEAVKIGEVK